MKKLLLAIPFITLLATAQNNVTVVDPFEQMDRLFKMQMEQMQRMQKQMDEMFKIFEQTNSSFQMPVIAQSGGIISSGLVDKKDHYEIVLNTSKDGKSKVNVEAKDNILTISVEEKKEIVKKTPHGEVKSFSTSSYMQSFTLPLDADASKISYDKKDGKIIVKIPKKKS